MRKSISLEKFLIYYRNKSCKCSFHDMDSLVKNCDESLKEKINTSIFSFSVSQILSNFIQFHTSGELI